MKIKVRARLKECSPDITEYRKYNPVLEFTDLFIELEVEGVKDGEKVVVKPEALASALANFAAAQYSQHVQTINHLGDRKDARQKVR